MPRSEEQFKEIREQKKALIKAVAIELFAEKGFDATSISMITSRASISKGLIYNYFDSKEHLIKVIITEGFAQFMDAFDTNKDGVLNDLEFEQFIDTTFVILESNLQFWKLYFMVMAHPKVMDLVMDELMQLLSPFLNIMTSYFSGKGYDDAVARARLFGATMDGVSLNFMVDPGSFPVDETKKLLKELFIK